MLGTFRNWFANTLRSSESDLANRETPNNSSGLTPNNATGINFTKFNCM